jgi:hypothetical protein
VHMHYPHLCPDLPTQSHINIAAPKNPQDISTQQQLDKLKRDISDISQALVTEQPGPSDLTPATVELYRTARYSLAAAYASRQGSSALPDKLPLPPNQNSWKETAERMGVKRAPKQNKRLPEERELNTRKIGVVKGRRPRAHNDPYGGGERPGKRAKSDAISPEANERARASAQSASIPASSNTAPPFTQPAHAFATHAFASPFLQPAPAPPFTQPAPAPPFTQSAPALSTHALAPHTPAPPFTFTQPAPAPPFTQPAPALATHALAPHTPAPPFTQPAHASATHALALSFTQPPAPAPLFTQLAPAPPSTQPPPARR